MVSPDAQLRIERILHDLADDPARRRELVAGLDSAESLQFLANANNWDDGFDVPSAIADHPLCDLGVALNLFWLADGIALLTGDTQPSEFNRAWAEFCQRLAGRITGGHYSIESTSFSPAAFYGRVRLFALKKRGVPEILINDVNGSTSRT